MSIRLGGRREGDISVELLDELIMGTGNKKKNGSVSGDSACTNDSGGRVGGASAT